MDDIVAEAVDVIIPGGGVGIVLLLVGLAGGDAVAEHFDDVAGGHFHAAHFVVQGGGIIDPVFEVVFVAAFVVEPGGGVALFEAFGFVGAFVALEVPDAGQEFGGGEFAHVVEKPLPVKAGAEAIFHYAPLVGGDGL